MEILDNRIILTDLVINILTYLEIQIKGLRLLCCQEAVTFWGINQEEQSPYCSSTAYTVDNAGKKLLLPFSKVSVSFGCGSLCAMCLVFNARARDWGKCLELTTAENLSWPSSYLARGH